VLLKTRWRDSAVNEMREKKKDGLSCRTRFSGRKEKGDKRGGVGRGRKKRGGRTVS